MKNNARHLAALALSACATFFVSDVRAYDESTHAIITQHAVGRSVVVGVNSVVIDLGFEPDYFFPTPDTLARNASNLVIFGSQWEDDLSLIKRVFNHFYDVQHGGRGLTVAGVTLGHGSVDWALEENGDLYSLSVGGIYYSPGDVPQLYSYRNAQVHYMAGLTGSTRNARETSIGMMFQTLGHVVHHMQDAAQPQHVRNEPHTPYQPVAPRYEDYTKNIWNWKILDLLNNNPYNNYAIPTFPRARMFWTQPNDPVAHLRGMADFTSRNYVSLHTNFGINGDPRNNPTIEANPDFPLPSGVNQDGTAKRVVTMTVPIYTSANTTVNRTMRFIVGKPYDEYASTPVLAERPLAGVSIFADPDGISPDMGSATMPDPVFDANYTTLLPRASAFSTGIINHFFRGRVHLQRTTPTGTNWTIFNTGSYPMNGEFTIYREDGNGNRALAGGPWNLAIGSGGSSQVSLTEPPSGTVNLVVAFRGQVGVEGSVASGFFSVAGKVVPFTQQQIPCGLPVSAQGSSEGYAALAELGTTAGPVNVEFEAYEIPDALVIKAVGPNGPVLYSTGGLVSGFRSFSVQHNPTATGSTKMYVQVTGNSDPQTRWTATVACPSRSISNDDRQQRRFSMGFMWNPNGTVPGGCPNGYYNIYVNSEYKGRVFWGVSGGSSTSATVTAGSHVRLRVESVTSSHGTPGTIGCPLVPLQWFDLNGAHNATIGYSWIAPR
jgi:hypothetical protein